MSRVNHFYLILGIALVLLSLTVFANAQTVSLNKVWSSDLNKIVDIRTYTNDANYTAQNIVILSQSNTGLVNCSIDSNYYLSCVRGTFAVSSSTVAIRAADVNAITRDVNFLITFSNVSPIWNSIPSQCINDSNTNLIDLRNYAFDVEDSNTNLRFALRNQDTVDGINCSVDSNRYVSCALTTNRTVSDTLTLRVTDTTGATSDTNAVINTNCYNADGNPTNDNNGFGIVTIESDTKDICLEQCVSTAIRAKVTNSTNIRKCFNFDAESSYYNMLNVSVSPSEFCLNAGESTYVSLSANSCGAEARPYTVTLFDQDSAIKMLFNYRVGSCTSSDSFRINETDAKVCQGETAQVSVQVRNNSSETKRIELLADNGMILPYFEKRFVDLASGEAKYVNLIINARALPVGEYRIELMGTSGDYKISKVENISVVDCAENPKRTFALSAPSVCYDAVRGGSIEGHFNITSQVSAGNTYFNTKKDFFLTSSGMNSQLSFNKVTLSPNQSKSITYNVTVPASAAAGKNYFTITASDGTEWNSFTESKNICINVLGENSASIFVRTQSMDIEWGSSSVFEIELYNNGDIDANFDLSVLEAPRGITVAFSENRVFLAKGERKVVYAIVSAGASAEVGANKVVKIYARGPVGLSADIYFNILEKTALDDLEILSYSNLIRTKTNSSADFVVMVRNSTDSVMRNVVLSIQNLPRDVNFEPITIAELLPGRVTSVSGTIKTGDTNGDFSSDFLVSTNGAANKKQFELVIERESNAGFAGLFGGFFSLGSINDGELIGTVFISLAFAFILIVLVGLIIYAGKAVTRPRNKESWAK
ncbi:NPCBM-associated, NEW3 domain of alpha-galactosidase [uncultured archaeon]|nr:NPCBM-associated, NEW3 domain of alpha-galactosidase [uncultured archaeon]